MNGEQINSTNDILICNGRESSCLHLRLETRRIHVYAELVLLQHCLTEPRAVLRVSCNLMSDILTEIKIYKLVTNCHNSGHYHSPCVLFKIRRFGD
jgi:hypothetical protein